MHPLIKGRHAKILALTEHYSVRDMRVFGATARVTLICWFC